MMNHKYLTYSIPHYDLNDNQHSVISEISNAIKSGDLAIKENHCMCGNNHVKKDVDITKEDCWGIPIGQVLCSKCGLVRNKYIFCSDANEEFYKHYYRKLYNSTTQEDLTYFISQQERGQSFVELLKKTSIFCEIKDVAEYGCGAGGILMPFQKERMKIVGVDLNEDFLKLGRLHGLNLISGQFDDVIPNNSCDLIILSHVLEHFSNPIFEVASLLPKIRQNKYLLVQVPGFHSNPKPYYPLSGFQIAHVYYFYKDWLTVFFESFGLKIVFCDDECTFICQKKNNDIPIVNSIWDIRLSLYTNKNKEILLACKNRYDKRLKKTVKQRLFNIACAIGWKRVRPYIKRNKT